MRTRITTAALMVTLPALLAAQGPATVQRLAVSPAEQLAEIDTDRIKGQPSRLAWSPDGSELYLQMMEGEFGKPAAAKLSHHVITLSDKRRKEVGAEPEWASAYWTAKSGQASPDSAAFKIELRSETRIERAVAAPMGGDLARGGTVGGGRGTSTGDAISAVYNQQRVPVHTMMLHGEIVGQFINSVIVPGQTFGWGPPGSKVIAYSAQKSGRLVIMDDKGTKQEIDGTKDVVFPAWSPDRTRLGWLQKDGGKKYVLKVATVR